MTCIIIYFTSKQTPVAEQNPFVDGTANILESLSSQDIAYHMAVYEWKLFTTVHEVSKP